MNPMVNLNNILEKELELERQGHRRTRRWIGDINHVSDEKWFQRIIHRISAEPYRSESSQVTESSSRQVKQSTPEKSLNLTRRRPACGEC
jgi:hypothetical protein